MMPPVDVLLESGLVGVVALAFVEKLVPAVPSYALYVFIGMTFAATRDELVGIAFASALGSTLGAACWYLLGRTLGRQRAEIAVVRFGRCLWVDPARYRRIASACCRRPFAVCLFGQVVPVVRLCVPLPAGVFALPPPTFAFATLLGSLAWNGPLIGAGHLLRGSGRDPATVGFALVAALLAAQAAMLAATRGWRWWHERKTRLAPGSS